MEEGQRSRVIGSAAWDIEVLPRFDLEHVAETAERGAARWRSTGHDPHFELTDSMGQPLRLPAGWYLLHVDMVVDDDEPVTPRIYPDYGCGYAESEAVRLEGLVHGKGVTGVLRFLQDVHALRFDPLDRLGGFSLGRMRLTRLSRLGAATRMLHGILGQERSPWRTLREAARQLWIERASLRGFGDWLYQWHHGARDTGAAGYAAWVERFDTLQPEDLRRLAGSAKALRSVPLISLIMPTYNTPRRWLERCIDSVRAQVYSNWELCIADDASTASHVRHVLQRYAKKDARIKVVFRETNGHISAASNSALALAQGEWIALLDHDDELPPHALLTVAEAINAHPEAGLFYSDEDKIDERGLRFDPYFKPDWNYDLFLGQNIICHLGVYRATMVRDLGGFRLGFEGSQDYDLALRCIERLQPTQIRHIPRVLYHWRAIAGSTAVSMGEKSYAALASQRALQEHLARVGADAEVEVHGHGYRVRRRLQGPFAPKVSLIVPTRDRLHLLRTCVESILERTSYSNYEIVVVDNQSSELDALAYLDNLRTQDRVRVLSYDEPFNFSAINNFAVAHCDGAIVGLVNNDIETIHANWLDEMVSQAVRPEIGAVGAMLYYPNDTIQHAGVILGIGGVAAHVYCGAPRGSSGQMSRALLTQDMSVVTAACLLVRREVYEQVGGLDERLQVAFNDVDFCLRVREAGYTNLWTPYAELYHHESASRGYEDTPEKKRRFESEVRFMLERWGESLNRDPAYNPNLTLSGAPFDLAFPPRAS
ncbi:MAG: glycosyltransferase family 2 protein [Xanthomonadaceae bacterium]|nr:glycosyltransferase family 2 protein [Xanthomonadaceae bacterium]